MAQKEIEVKLEHVDQLVYKVHLVILVLQVQLDPEARMGDLVRKEILDLLDHLDHRVHQVLKEMLDLQDQMVLEAQLDLQVVQGHEAQMALKEVLDQVVPLDQLDVRGLEGKMEVLDQLGHLDRKEKGELLVLKEVQETLEHLVLWDPLVSAAQLVLLDQ